MKPEWLRIRLDTGRKFAQTASVLRSLNLSTVCNGARCPNKSTCWGNGTATFMIMGQVCTRNCRFCSVASGKPEKLDESEPFRLAEAVKRLALTYTVITSVDRDDLEDGGAGHFAKCVQAVKKTEAKVEVLIPDYDRDAIKRIVDSLPDVIGHNIEVVRRLTPDVRDVRAGYEKSLEVLREVKRLNNKIKTKSSLMLGVGETQEEVMETICDLWKAGVDMLTIGQYLRPTKNQIEVARYVPPAEFSRLGKTAEDMGFVCSSGPFVRSSFNAALMLRKAGG